ncbi:MAG: ATP-binding protein [Gemmatimonadota bacterium]|nr:ATP-binding protein [Gemmatimonadota bacterium]
MVYRHFRTLCIVRVAFLCATICALAYVLFETSYYTTVLILAGMTLYQAYALIHYVERTSRDLTRFLQAVRYEDFSQSFSGRGLGAAFDDLKEAFNEVLNAFRRTRAEKEENFQYLQTVVQHVGVGLVCYGSNGRIELMNTAAQRLLRRPHIHNVRELEPVSETLADTLLALGPGDRTLVKVQDEDELLQIIIHATEIRMRGESFILASVQDIQSELEEQEMEAWQKLIRVLIHEIMNSITPISSLASTVRGHFPESGRSSPLDQQTAADVSAALETIQSRSEGLQQFVDTYRQLTRIPRPDFQICPVVGLFDRVASLMNPECESAGIALRTRVEPETLEVTADPNLVEQALINLVRNAAEALAGRDQPRVDLTASLDRRGRVLIRVQDNGPGILDEVQDRIFIPFFTTRQEGSGIGLSLCRQIMRQHRGAISVQSTPDEETVFTLRF